MFMNEDAVMQTKEYSDTDFSAVDLDLDAAGDSPAAANGDQDQEVDLDLEDVDLDYDALKNNGFKVDTTPYVSKSSVDLDYSYALRANGNSSQEDTVHNDVVDLDLEEVDLDNTDELENQTTFDDGIHDECGNADCDKVVEGVAFSEQYVRVFPRSDYNLIMESDVYAVMACHNLISEDEAIHLIAEYHNLDEDNIMVLQSEASSIGGKSKKAKAKKTGIDFQIENLKKRKDKMTAEAWKKSGLNKKLKELYAKKTISSK